MSYSGAGAPATKVQSITYKKENFFRDFLVVNGIIINHSSDFYHFGTPVNKEDLRNIPNIYETIKDILNGDVKIDPLIIYTYMADIPEIENGYATNLKTSITDIQTNKAEDKHNWRVII